MVWGKTCVQRGPDSMETLHSPSMRGATGGIMAFTYGMPLQEIAAGEPSNACL